MEKETQIMIDPPSGWLYGFPKYVSESVYEKFESGDLIKWLLENGYPQHEIDRCGDHFYVRFAKIENDKDD